jgi:dUTP pyrophosphatase
MNPVDVTLQRLEHAQGLDLPAYASDGAAGLDLPAAVAEAQVIQPGARALVPTGFAIQLPAGFEAQVRPRSGLAVKHGISIVNAPGTVDSDYRGEIMVCLINLGEAPFTINRGDRIAQLVVAPVTRVTLREARTLDDTTRGTDGFGSTGVRPARTGT